MLNYQGVYIEKGKDLEVEWGLQAASYRLSLVIHGQSLWVKNPRYGVSICVNPSRAIVMLSEPRNHFTTPTTR